MYMWLISIVNRKLRFQINEWFAIKHFEGVISVHHYKVDVIRLSCISNWSSDGST